MSYPGHIQNAQVATSGDFVSGKVKLAITIRLIAGGDSYDLGAIFDLAHGSCLRIMYEVINKWIIGANIGNVDMDAYLADENAKASVSEGFSRSSNGVLTGSIGAIDDG